MPTETSNSPARILVVEDDMGDQILIQESLQTSPVRKKVHVVSDGEEALEYLYRTGRYAPPVESHRPDLILLDLNMPRLGGKEVGARLKADPEMKAIPIVAFTTSDREEDVAACYALGFNCYVKKPTDFEEFQAALLHLERFWLQVSLPPPRSGRMASPAVPRKDRENGAPFTNNPLH